MTATTTVDEHTALLWQVCAYADELAEAQERGAALEPLRRDLLACLQDRLYDDHTRLRAEADAVASAHSAPALLRRTRALVELLDLQVRREEPPDCNE